MSFAIHLQPHTHTHTHSDCITAQKCCGECIEGNLAHLQAYEVSEASESGTSSNASEEIPVGNLCVSLNFHHQTIERKDICTICLIAKCNR